MTGSALQSAVIRDLAAEVPAEVTEVARTLAARLGGVAVLFYGSVLRTRQLGDILDFYVLTDRDGGLASRYLWPDVSFQEIPAGGRVIRAKVATMTLATFERAATGVSIDTTVWVRFAQPSALVWARGQDEQARVTRAVAAAATTAASFAAALGPRQGRPADYWQALLRETYRAELRVEAPGRELQVLGHAPERYDRLLPLAWDAAGIPFDRGSDGIAPRLSFGRCRRLAQAWLTRAAMGKALNIARLVKAAFTFEGAARYGLWKIERHTGVHIALTPWRERHPVLAGPGVLWRVLRAQNAAARNA